MRLWLFYFNFNSMFLIRA